MEVRWEIVAIILGSAAVTFVPRVLPLMVMSRFALPEWVMKWLGYVPVAVMAAMVAQEVLTQNGQLALRPDHPELWAAVLALLAAILSRSLLVTVLSGVIALMLLRAWL